MKKFLGTGLAGGTGSKLAGAIAKFLLFFTQEWPPMTVPGPLSITYLVPPLVCITRCPSIPPNPSPSVHRCIGSDSSTCICPHKRASHWACLPLVCLEWIRISREPSLSFPFGWLQPGMAWVTLPVAEILWATSPKYLHLPYNIIVHVLTWKMWGNTATHIELTIYLGK